MLRRCGFVKWLVHQSSVCAAYRRQLTQVKREQGMALLNPHAWSMQDLKAKELSLNAVIADACE